MNKKTGIILLTLILLVSSISVSPAADTGLDKGNDNQQLSVLSFFKLITKHSIHVFKNIGKSIDIILGGPSLPGDPALKPTTVNSTPPKRQAPSGNSNTIPGPELTFSDHGKTFDTSSPLLKINVSAYTELKEDVKIKINKKNVSGEVQFTDGNKRATILVRPEELNDGLNGIEVKVKDISGNQSTREWTFNISEKPVIIETVPADGGTIERNGSITIKLADNGGIDPDTIILMIDGIRVEHYFDETTGIVSCDLSNIQFPQPAAMFAVQASDYQPVEINSLLYSTSSHTASITASDLNGNILSSSWGFTILSAGMGPSLSFNYAGADINTGSPDLSVTVTSNSAENISSAYVIKVDGVIVDAELRYKGHWESDSCSSWWVVDSYKEATIIYQAAGLSDGPHTIEVTAKDNAGNITTQSWTFNVAELPVFYNKYPTRVTNVNNAVSVQISDNDPVDASSIVLKVDGSIVSHTYDSAAGKISYHPETPLADGSHSVWVSAKGTGSGVAGSTSWSYTIETSGPELTFAGAGTTFTSNSPNLVVNAKTIYNDLEEYSIFKVDGVAVSAAFSFPGHWESDSCSTWWVVDSYRDATLTYQASGLTDGTHTLEVTAKDVAGNITVEEWTFFVDTSASRPVRFSTTNYTVMEGDSAVITVERSGILTTSSTVVFSTAGNSAVAAADYSPLTQTVSFEPGETTKTVIVPTIDDNSYEGPERFKVTLSSPGGCILGSTTTAFINISDNDPIPEISFSTGSYTVDEGDTVTVTVVRSGATGGASAVNYATSEGTASLSDFVSSAGTLSFGPGETVKTFTVTINTDMEIEEDEALYINLSDPVDADLTTPADAVLTIVDTTPLPVIELDSITYSMNEGGSVNITLSRSALGTVSTVNYITSDVTAAGGTDYTAASGTVVFATGELSKTITLTSIDDTTFESDESFSLALSNPTAAELGDNTNTEINIIENDAPPIIEFVSAAYSVAEDAGSVTVTVRRSTDAAVPSTAAYATTDGTAEAGSDFASWSGTVTFNPGELEKSFDIAILNDAFYEYDETFYIGLSNPTMAALGSQSNTEITITDDDPVPVIEFVSSPYMVSEGDIAVITLARSGGDSITSTVEYATADGTANASTDYTPVSGTVTFAPGENVKTINISATEDISFEIDETITVNLSSPVDCQLPDSPVTNVTILNDDTPPDIYFMVNSVTAEEGEGATVTVIRSGDADCVSSINYTLSDNTATGGNDYVLSAGTVTFSAGETSKTFTVNLLEDSIYEGTESLTVNLQNPVNADLGSPSALELKISDNDPAPVLEFNAASYFVDESAGIITVQVNKTGNTAVEATAEYATGDNTAGAGTDYTAVSGTLTFAPAETSKTITIEILDDAVFEPDESFIISLNDPINAVTGIRSDTVVTVADNDPVPFVQFDSGTFSVNEGGTGTITVKRTGDISNPSSADYYISDGSAAAGEDYVSAAGILNFAAGEGLKTFTIDTIDDFLYEGDEDLTLTLSNPSNAVLGSQERAELIIVDDDPPPVIEFTVTLSNIEEGSSAAITVQRTGSLGGTSSVDYFSGDITAVEGQDYTPVNGRITFAPGESTKVISVNILDDSLYENDETFNITLSHITGAHLGPNDVTRVIINDNELSLIAFSPGLFEVAEGDSVTVTVARTGDTANIAVVSYAATGAGTAQAGFDYTPVSGTLTFNPGETAKTFSVSTIHDNIAEYNERINIELQSCTGSTLEGLGAQKLTTVTILDDDTPSGDIVELEFSSPYFVAVPLGTTTETYLYGISNDGERTDVTQISTWNSSNPEVATVNTGRITGRGVGTTVVSAKYNSLVKEITVVVR